MTLESPPSSQLSPVEYTLTSLIQQYLSLLQPENATFLAERLVAYHPSPHSYYMLAMCHYRSGSPKRAHAVLLDVPVEDEIMGDCILHLAAQCCMDMRSWVQAEDYLLRNARAEYAGFKKIVKDDDVLKQMTLDEWLVQRVENVKTSEDIHMKNKKQNLEHLEDLTKSHSSLLPIPNGAVGFKLLGDICRKTLRIEKAALYYRLSLKLDPMMWCCYEALCEIGHASEPENDPSVVFGVIPHGLLSIPSHMGGYGSSTSHYISSHGDDFRSSRSFVQESPFNVNHSPIITAGDNIEMIQYENHDFPMTMTSNNAVASGSAARLSFGTTPIQTPYGYNATQDILNPEHERRQSVLRGSSLFQKPPPTGRKSRLPSAMLFSTPATPSQTTAVLDRAKKIAGRRYYEPSPETTPPHAIGFTTIPQSSLKTSKMKYRRSYIGMGGHNDTRYEYDEKTNDDRRTLFENSIDPYGDVAVESTRMDTTMDLSAMKSTKRIQTKSALRTKTEELAVGGREESKVSEPKAFGSSEYAMGDSDEGVHFVMDLLATLGAAQRMLCSFKCKEAIQILQMLPHSQYQTGWVQHQVGRAYLALPDYSNAQRAFETMQQLEPHRMKGLELLSTALYLLKKEVELSNLSQRVTDFDIMAPETWCIVGNLFSLQKDSRLAMKYFGRAVQVDPDFTYAHTLCGHEHVMNEDFDQAINSFRNAIRLDDRHYNAWNGLGEIYFKQEKYDLAEKHFQKGLSINPQSSVIRCHLSQAQQALGNLHLALDTLMMVDERNPQAQFQRANILLALDRCEEALLEMEKVRDASPREASVYTAMGRIYKRLGKTDQAMKAFLFALDLDPKDNNAIKAAIDRIDEPDLDEDVSAF